MRRLGLGKAGDRIIYEAAALARDEHRFGVTIHLDNDGEIHLKGATDTRGYTACGFKRPGRPPCRHKFPCPEHGREGGGMKVSGRTIDPASAVWGLRSSDLAALSADLAAIGKRVKPARVEALLMEAQYVLSGGKLPRKSKGVDLERKRASANARKRRSRAKMLQAGKCANCGVNERSPRKDGKLGRKCVWCRWDDQQAVQRARAAKRAQAA